MLDATRRLAFGGLLPGLVGAALLIAGCGGSPGSDPLDGGASDAIVPNDADTDAHVDAGGDAAAVFAVVVGENGSIAHCDDQACHSATSPVQVELDGVDVVSADRAFAVGCQGTILHWDGSTWQEQSSPSSMNLVGVDAVGEDLAYAVGEDGIICWRGMEPTGRRWTGSSTGGT